MKSRNWISAEGRISIYQWSIRPLNSILDHSRPDRSASGEKSQILKNFVNSTFSLLWFCCGRVSMYGGLFWETLLCNIWYFVREKSNCEIEASCLIYQKTSELSQRGKCWKNIDIAPDITGALVCKIMFFFCLFFVLDQSLVIVYPGQWLTNLLNTLLKPVWFDPSWLGGLYLTLMHMLGNM